MDIRANAATKAYETALQSAQPKPGTEGSTNVGSTFLDAFRGYENTLQTSEALSKEAMTTGADPHELVHALAQTEFAVEAAVTVRDRVVEAYQEILRMPV